MKKILVLPRISGNFMTVAATCVYAAALTGCGSAPEVTAAKLINALATKSVLKIKSSGESEVSTVPSRASCNSDVFTITSQTMELQLTLGDDTAEGRMAFSINATGPGIAEATEEEGETHETLYCNINAKYGYDTIFTEVDSTASPAVTTTTLQLSGSGTLTTCDHYECIFSGTKIPCEDLDRALQETACY